MTPDNTKALNDEPILIDEKDDGEPTPSCCTPPPKDPPDR